MNCTKRFSQLKDQWINILKHQVLSSFSNLLDHYSTVVQHLSCCLQSTLIVDFPSCIATQTDLWPTEDKDVSFLLWPKVYLGEHGWAPKIRSLCHFIRLVDWFNPYAIPHRSRAVRTTEVRMCIDRILPRPHTQRELYDAGITSLHFACIPCDRHEVMW